jgi:hypothetical protein
MPGFIRTALLVISLIAAPALARSDDAVYTVSLDSNTLGDFSGAVQINRASGSVNSFDVIENPTATTYTFTGPSSQADETPGADSIIHGSVASLPRHFTLNLARNGTYYLSTASSLASDYDRLLPSIPAPPTSNSISLLLIGIAAIMLAGAAQWKLLRH